ncbi:MAG: ribbon-helix-helix protein, CopG family [Coriobacteriia bacterium]
MAKPTISLPDGMLEDVDHRAALAGISRSAFIQEAIAHYGADLDAGKEHAERYRRISEAMASAREIANRLPSDTPDAESIIRAVRDAPPRWLREEDE